MHRRRNQQQHDGVSLSDPVAVLRNTNLLPSTAGPSAQRNTTSHTTGPSDPVFFDFGLWWDEAEATTASPRRHRQWSASNDSPLLSSSHQLWSHEDPSEVKGECFATLAQLVLALEAEEFVVRTFQEEHKSDEDRTPVAIGARFSTLIKLAESAGWEKDTTVPGIGKIPFSISTATEKPDLYREWTNRALFFSSGERIQLMTYKIHNVATLRRELLSFRSRMSFFPLHSLEGNAKLTKAVVYDIGSRSGLGGMSSELEDHIVDYFGPSLGFYFGFLSFYTQSLSLPALVGVYLFLTDEDPTSPNFEVGIFSCLLLLVAMLFMKTWRRHQSALATRWLRFTHAAGQVGRVRHPDYAQSEAKIEERRLREDTGFQRYFQPRFWRWAFGKCLAWSVHAMSVVLTWVSVMMLHYLDDHFPRLVQQYNLFDPSGYSVGNLVVEYLPTLVFVLGLAVLEPGLDWLCKEIHEWEVYSNEVTYRAGLARKRIESKFFLRHSSLFWSAYYEQDAEMLSKVLTTYIVLYAFTSTVVEVLTPKIAKLRAPRDPPTGKGLYAHVVANGHLSPYSSSFDEYLTLYIQFGQVLMFSAFFPLAPACAWIANMLESRLDGYKLLRDVRRPLPLTHCAEGIGPAWTEAFETIVFLSVLTNLSSIALFAPSQVWVWTMDQIRVLSRTLETHGALPDGYTSSNLNDEMPLWLKIAIVAFAENVFFYFLWKISQLADETPKTRELRLMKEVRWRKAIETYNRQNCPEKTVVR
eukprot:m.201502 g.201502  ORF g.201502 m.201502 type:complete len:752 (-) comp15345_c0_seq7:2586-4841(-)